MPTAEKASRLMELIHLLDQATDRGTLPWEGTSDEDEFRALLKTGLVKIRKTNDFLREPSANLAIPVEEKCTVRILDSFNREIEFLVPSTPEEAEQLRELFCKARRSVLEIDRLYGAFLKELKSRAGQQGD